jgi:hypothetical protein
MAAAFKPTFGRLDGTVNASGATDHDALLEASELMPVGAEQVFEKAHSISAHDYKSLFAVMIGLPRTDGFDLAQYSTYFGSLMPARPFRPPWTVEDVAYLEPPAPIGAGMASTGQGALLKTCSVVLPRRASRNP